MTTEYECLGGPLDGAYYFLEDPKVGASYILEATYRHREPVHGREDGVVVEVKTRLYRYWFCGADHLHFVGEG